MEANDQACRAAHVVRVARSPRETSLTMTALAALVHDPEARILERWTVASATLTSIFKTVGIVLAPGTSRQWARAPDLPGVTTVSSETDEVGENRRETLRLALAMNADAVLYADLDRVIHWALTRPAELERIAGGAHRSPFTVVGRTAAAMATHPLSQRLPENATNEAVSAALGQSADVTSGCCAMTSDTAHQLLRLSTAAGVTTDAEWPLLVALGLSGSIETVAVDGLDFETADYYPDEIQHCGGLETWVRMRYGTVDAWLARLRAADATVSVAAQITARQKVPIDGGRVQ
jgi:hypothetical protein